MSTVGTMQDLEKADRSRNGYIVHKVTSSGRWVEVTAYLEGVEQRPVVTRLLCRTQEQAAACAAALNGKTP